MAHFALLDANDTVVNVLVVDNIVLMEPDGSENEAKGIAHLEHVCGPEFKYVQTSINANFRGEYATIGGTYDRANDVFRSIADSQPSQPQEGFEWN
jgi:hypothetical protein